MIEAEQGEKLLVPFIQTLVRLVKNSDFYGDVQSVRST